MSQSSMTFNEEKFEEGLDKIKAAKKEIARIFSSESKDMEKINNTDYFSGDTSQELGLKYQELSQNYDGIIDSIQHIINFLESVAESHRKMESGMINNLESQQNNLNVNS